MNIGEGAPEPVERLLAAMVQLLVETWHPHQIILFGSRATGRARKTSDVDLVVVVPSALYTNAVAGAMLDALAPFRYPVDIVLATPQVLADDGQIPGVVLHEALTKGRILWTDGAGDTPGGAS